MHNLIGSGQSQWKKKSWMRRTKKKRIQTSRWNWIRQDEKNHVKNCANVSTKLPFSFLHFSSFINRMLTYISIVFIVTIKWFPFTQMSHNYVAKCVDVIIFTENERVSHFAKCNERRLPMTTRNSRKMISEPLNEWHCHRCTRTNASIYGFADVCVRVNFPIRCRILFADNVANEKRLKAYVCNENERNQYLILA